MAHRESAPEDFNALLLRLYRLSRELPVNLFQDQALALVKRVLPFESSWWGTASITDGGIDIHTVHLHEKTPEMLAAYESVKHIDTAAAVMFSQARTTRAFHSRSWYDSADFLDFTRAYQHENMFITTAVDQESQFVQWLSLFREDPEHHARPAELRQLHLLAPHLMEALAINRLVHLERLDPNRQNPKGVAIADTKGYLHHSDSLFDSMLRAQWSDWRGPYLPADLVAHLQGTGPLHQGTMAVVSGALEHGLLFLTSRLRCRADALSPRELTVAQLVAQGSTYKEIARMLNRSPATVRNHIQAIYDKLQVGSIARLIHELRYLD